MPFFPHFFLGSWNIFKCFETYILKSWSHSIEFIFLIKGLYCSSCFNWFNVLLLFTNLYIPSFINVIKVMFMSFLSAVDIRLFFSKFIKLFEWVQVIVYQLVSSTCLHLLQNGVWGWFVLNKCSFVTKMLWICLAFNIKWDTCVSFNHWWRSQSTISYNNLSNAFHFEFLYHSITSDFELDSKTEIMNDPVSLCYKLTGYQKHG